MAAQENQQTQTRREKLIPGHSRNKVGPTERTGSILIEKTGSSLVKWTIFVAPTGEQ